jgi:4-diphosphocytidyl-2-C-methyl-D-erythritol kinase
MTRSELAPIKLNLFLHIVGRRADGYHLLESLFVFADVGDRISYAPSAAPLSLDIVGPFAAQLRAEPDNLVLRAARLLKHAPTGTLTLDKQVPVASGLGGGSADAAATLRLLNRIWQCGHSSDALRQLGAALGADVPACIDSCAAYVSGIGEHLAPASETQELAIVVANPGIATATPTVFEAYRRQGSDFSAPLPVWPPASASWPDCQNDLAAPAQAVTPEITTLIQRLAELPGAQMILMSGSGASCFALFPTRAQAAAAAQILSSRYPQWWITDALIKAPHSQISAT